MSQTSHQPTHTPSIFFRLALSYVLLACLLTLLSISVLYYGLNRLVKDQSRQFLTGELNTLINIIEQSPSATTRNSNLYQEIVLEPKTSKYHYFVRIVDQYGHTLVETPNMQSIIPTNQFPILAPSSALSDVITIRHQQHKHYALITANHLFTDTPLTIQIALDYSDSYHLIIHYRRTLLLILLINVLLSLFIGFLLTRQGLRPLKKLNRLLSRLDVDQLDQRLHDTDWPKELQQTAHNLNGMLTRIEKVFTRLQQFSAELAHEMRTPINSMRCQIEVSLSQERSKKEYHQALINSLEECHRISHLIDDMLFIAKSTHPHYMLANTEIAIRPLLDNLIEYLTLLAEEKGITFQIRGEATLMGDEKLLKRAFNNILVNSIKHSKPQQSITIEIQSTTHQAIITVQDKGVGIPPEALEHVFKRFYRVDKARSRDEGGTGLGLAIVKSIIELHHGNVTLTSQPQRGTTVTITLPLSR
ncbi:MAG: heavy metal sensor histidine kinase [Gammaproteobacteria bacterium]|nr:heavy metal sensor histidine kinase [Gammaproteobacteria bacterium]